MSEISSTGTAARSRRARGDAASPRLRRAVLAASSHQSGGLLVAVVLLMVVFTVTTSTFLTWSNLSVVLVQVTPVGVLAIPAAMLLLAGYIDLSVGAVAWLAAAVFGLLMHDVDWALVPSFVAALLVGAGWGAANGYLTGYVGASPIVISLAGFSGARAIGDALTNDNTRSGFGDTFVKLGNADVLGIPVPALIFIALFCVAVFAWYGTPLGRHLTAIGADRDAARSIGVSIRAIPFWAYVLSGLMAALGGLIATSQLDAASPSVGAGLELEVLTAVLLGGVSFSGGRGSLWGVLFGVVFVGVLTNGLVLLDTGPYYTNIAVGAVLLVVALIDVAYQRLERLPAAPPSAADEQEAQA